VCTGDEDAAAEVFGCNFDAAAAAAVVVVDVVVVEEVH